MASKKIMTAIKRAVSPVRPQKSADYANGNGSIMMEHTPFTKFVINRLTGKELFAVSFAVQMKVDKHALVIDLADCLSWLGIDRIDSAVRLLKRHFEGGQYKAEKIFHTVVEKAAERGRRPVQYLISLDILET